METIAPSIAATLTTATFVPQAYKIIRSRETAGVSLLMHAAFAGGVAFWFALGVILWNWPMILRTLSPSSSPSLSLRPYYGITDNARASSNAAPVRGFAAGDLSACKPGKPNYSAIRTFTQLGLKWLRSFRSWAG